MKISIDNMRLVGVDKRYYKNQLVKFAELFSEDKINCVAFGKQDIRGGFSITLIDKRSCVPMQKFFTNKWEMLGYVVGVVECEDGMDRWKNWLKEVSNE